jgi:hypothetical protein
MGMSHHIIMGMSHHMKWLVFSPMGLSLIGLGVSITGEAIRAKTMNEPWFWLGTLGLAVLNAGVAVFGDGVKHRVRMELEAQNKHERSSEQASAQP